MRTTTIALGLAAATLTTMLALTDVARADDKADIEALEKSVAAGIEAKDADAVMANYVPGDSLVVFDIIPPRQYTGLECVQERLGRRFQSDVLTHRSWRSAISTSPQTASSRLATASSISHARIPRAIRWILRCARPMPIAKLKANGSSCMSTFRRRSISRPVRPT